VFDTRARGVIAAIPFWLWPPWTGWAAISWYPGFTGVPARSSLLAPKGRSG